jgi:hypothetical protein
VLVLVVGLFSVGMLFSRELHRTTPYWKKGSESLSGWLQSPHRDIPQFLANRVGKPYLPMNIQWVGEVGCVREELKKMGWRPASVTWDIPNLIKRLAVDKAEDHLPIFKRRFKGKKPVIVYIKQAEKNKNTLELYLWQSNVRVNEARTQVLVGFLNQRDAKPLYKHTDPAKMVSYQSGKVAQYFMKKLSSAYQYQRVVSLKQSDKKYQGRGWSGDTWLIYPAEFSASTGGSGRCP